MSFFGSPNQAKSSGRSGSRAFGWLTESDRLTDLRLLAATLFERGELTGAWEAEDWAKIADERRAAAARAAAERQLVAEVVMALERAGAPALLLKGMALAYTVYPQPWLRPHADVDLLVPPGTGSVVRECLTRRGYAPEIEISHPLLTTQSHYTRSGPVALALDVHETLVNPYVLRTLPTYDELFARAQRIAALGASARALSTADALLHALVHRVAHHNSSVDRLWLYDMHLLATELSDEEWRLIARTATRASVCALAADGLTRLAEVQPELVPAWVLSEMAAAHGEPSAALLGGTMTELRLQLINFRSLPDLRTRAQFVRAHLAPPSAELGGKPLPRWRLPARYLTRIVHGVRKWTTPISRRR